MSATTTASGATLRASYRTASLGTTTLPLRKTYRILPEWLRAGVHAVVLPVCHGKSTLADRLGGYDYDAITSDGADPALDEELNNYISHLGDWATTGESRAIRAANQISEARAMRFFETVRPDANSPIVYVHTIEVAVGLRLPILAAYELPDSVLIATPRAADTEGFERTLAIASAQRDANRAYALKHGHRAPLVMRGYDDIFEHLSSLAAERELGPGPAHLVKRLVDPEPTEARGEYLDRLYHVVRDRSRSGRLRALAARRIFAIMPDPKLTPVEAQTLHCHEAWADIVHRVIGAVVSRGYARGEVVPVPTVEADVVEKFPYASGNSKFALMRISTYAETATTPPSMRRWANQLAKAQAAGSVDRCSYERLLATMMFDDLLDAEPQYVVNLIRDLPLAFFPTYEYIKLTEEVHRLVRSTCTYLGVELSTKQLAMFTYFNCLAGRINADVDMDAEAKAREEMRRPKRYFRNGAWSESVFDDELCLAIRDLYSEGAANLTGALLKLGEEYTDFEPFLKDRKSWAKSGSATGGFKADIYLSAPAEHAEVLANMSEDLIRMSGRVLTKMRLRMNKTALFEFKDFIHLVEDALDNYEPNSFSRYFIKKEVGKSEGRALYPSTTIHYVVSSFVLRLAEQMGPVTGTRMLALPTQQRDDHYYWVQASEFTSSLMLDYAAFNEQHTTQSMKLTMIELATVFERAGLLSADMKWAIGWVVSSFDNVCVEVSDRLVHFTSGLLSGWRQTSFTNSYLNAAYLRVIAKQGMEMLGVPVLADFMSGGDDVVVEEDSLRHMCIILTIGDHMGFVFKPIKQLICSKYREFFRLFVSGDGVYGPLCRVLGSAASGQWSNSVIGKFVEPASKLASAVEVLAKVQRRSGAGLSAMERMQVCVYDKWARSGEVKLVTGLIHGLRCDGGLGIPRLDGSVYAIDIAKRRPDASVVSWEHVPHDASLAKAEQLVRQAREFMGDGVLDPEDCAKQWASSVFTNCLASSQGVGVAQALFPVDADYYGQPVEVVGVLNVEPQKTGKSLALFRQRVQELQYVTKPFKKAIAKYASLKAVVPESGHYELAERVSVAAGSLLTAEMLVRYVDQLTLYGPARYGLTEDYYEDVCLLSLYESDGGQHEYCQAAADWWYALNEEGVLAY